MMVTDSGIIMVGSKAKMKFVPKNLIRGEGVAERIDVIKGPAKVVRVIIMLFKKYL